MAKSSFWSKIRRSKADDFAGDGAAPAAAAVPPAPPKLRIWPRRVAARGSLDPAAPAAVAPAAVAPAVPSADVATPTETTPTTPTDVATPTEPKIGYPAADTTDSGRAKPGLPKLKLPKLPRTASRSAKQENDLDKAHDKLLAAERPANELDLEPNVGELAILEGPDRGVLEVDALEIMAEASSTRFDATTEALDRLLHAPPQLDSPIDHLIHGAPPTDYIPNEIPAPPPQIPTRATYQQGYTLRGAALSGPRHPRRPTRAGDGGPIIRG